MASSGENWDRVWEGKSLRQDLGQGEEGKAELVSQEVKMLWDLGRVGAEQSEGSEATPTLLFPLISSAFLVL